MARGALTAPTDPTASLKAEIAALVKKGNARTPADSARLLDALVKRVDELERRIM